jgi:hypothetical protein
MNPRFILAVTDFSSHGGNALSRAALLSAEHGAALKIAYIALPGDTPPPDAAARLDHHALQLSQAHGISALPAGKHRPAPSGGATQREAPVSQPAGGGRLH